MAMELFLLALKTTFTIALVFILSTVIQMFDAQVWRPKRLRSKLRKQGLKGPRPSFLTGNGAEMRKTQKMAIVETRAREQPGEISHDISYRLFPFFENWKKEYGPTFMFSMGNIQIIHMNNPEVVKEISTCTSWDLGKPAYQHQERGPLLGQGILTSNGTKWAYQRKIIAPELYADKVKGMMMIMVESANILIDTWMDRVRSEGVTSDIKVDGYMKKFSGNVISRACFGSNYLKGEEIFLKLGELQDVMSRRVLSSGIPILRYVPTKENREIWRLEKEIKKLILKVVDERSKSAAAEKDLLQMLLLSAKNSDLNKSEFDNFIVDNCKNIYLAGYETTAITGTWLLMLLAAHPEWQERVRAEALEVCQGQMPDADMVRKMKTLTMVVHETLRLYPPVTVISREALKDMKFGDITLPKGVNVWTLTVSLHADPEIWGPDAHKFNPDRFVNGVSGACKLPYVYMPFGVGPRTCVGQNLALAELKILVSMVVTKFSFTLSSKYIHRPTLKLLTEPEDGVTLKIRKL